MYQHLVKKSRGPARSPAGVAGLALAFLLISPGIARGLEPRLEWSVFGGAVRISPDHQLRDVALVPFGPPQPNPGLALGPVGGVRFGLLATDLLGVEVEGALAPLSYASYAGDVRLFPVRGHVTLQLPRYHRFGPMLVAGGGVIVLQGGDYTPGHDLGNDVDASGHWGVGLKVGFTRSLVGRVDVRHVLTSSYDGSVASHFEALASFTFAPNRRVDLDRDGLLDADDACPELASVRPDGCPDRDGDGVVDPKDACVDVAGASADGCAPPDADQDGFADAADACVNVAGTLKGCPDGDKDGVADASDQCPALAGRASDGCPDQDGDGVIDPNDACPAVAGTMNGCPDTDKDAVSDADDKCPKEPETLNAFDDADGCPDAVPADVQKILGVSKTLVFDLGKTELPKGADKTIDAAAKALKKSPTAKLEIVASTDGGAEGTGDALKLTAARAEAIKAALVKKGVEGTRLVATGAGASKPLAQETNDANKAKNRRVELKLAP